MSNAEKCPRCKDWTHKLFRFEGELMCADCSEDITAERIEPTERKKHMPTAELERIRRENRIADNFRKTGLIR